jgi:hypothetical protein
MDFATFLLVTHPHFFDREYLAFCEREAAAKHGAAVAVEASSPFDFHEAFELP